MWVQYIGFKYIQQKNSKQMKIIVIVSKGKIHYRYSNFIMEMHIMAKEAHYGKQKRWEELYNYNSISLGHYFPVWLVKEHNTVLYKNISQYIKFPLKINTVASHVDVFHYKWTFVHLGWKQLTVDSSKILTWELIQRHDWHILLWKSRVFFS